MGAAGRVFLYRSSALACTRSLREGNVMSIKHRARSGKTAGDSSEHNRRQARARRLRELV
jgi:hypothetical protein